MIQTTSKQAMAAFMAITEIRAKVKGPDALALFKLKNRLKENVDFFGEEELKLVDEYGGKIAEDGMVVLATEKLADFRKAHKELEDMACEVEAEPVTISIEKNPEITLEEMDAMNGFVNFE